MADSLALTPSPRCPRPFGPPLLFLQEKEKLKLLLKKCLRISDEVHLECLEEAMSAKKPRKSEGGKKDKSGAGYAGAGGPAGKKRKSEGGKSRKVSRSKRPRPRPPPPFFLSLSLSLPALPCLSDLISNANNNQQPTKSGPLVVDEYIGRKVERWWPDDGGWVSGAISDYNAVTGEHCIVYELGTADESWEWYNVRNASNAQCRMVEGAKVDLLAMTKAPGAMNTGGFDTVETLEGLEQVRQKLLSRKEEIEQQLAQLEDSDSDNITYSDSDPE